MACCNDETSNTGSRPGCKSSATYSDAEAHCKANGKVLCSVSQIENGAARGSGCSFDAYHQWTRDSCGDSSVVVKSTDGTSASSGKHSVIVGNPPSFRKHSSGDKPNACVSDDSTKGPNKNSYGEALGRGML